MAERLTDRFVRSQSGPQEAYSLHWDSDIKGFGLRVTAAGAKSFILNYRAGARGRRYTIGAYPDWSVAAAREEAKRLKREIDQGQDPMGERHKERAAPTMRDLADRYLEVHASKKRESSRREDASMLKNFVLPQLGAIRVAEVRHADIERLHRNISKRAPYRANRTVALLSKMFSLAMKWEWRADNPARGVERNPEVKRDRYLSLDELQRLSNALANHSNQRSANVIRFLLLTGARRGEVLSATWDQFDLETGIWTKPSAHTKQKKDHRVPLSAPALKLLSDMRAKEVHSTHVFPGRIPGEPIREIRKTWTSVCKQAGITNCRIHDLRHTYASILASAGMSLPVIGALLGHTQPNTTARYAHLFDDPLREATERVGRLVSAIESGNSGDIIELREGRKQ